MFFASPNNPTGNPLTIPQVEQLCKLGATIIIDEAYLLFPTTPYQCTHLRCNNFSLLSPPEVCYISSVSRNTTPFYFSFTFVRYAEFCEDSWRSAKELIPHIPNLVVLRTFSKWAGLAGLRVGYGAAHPKVTEWMMAIKQPYPFLIFQAPFYSLYHL